MYPIPPIVCIVSSQHLQAHSEAKIFQYVRNLKASSDILIFENRYYNILKYPNVMFNDHRF